MKEIRVIFFMIIIFCIYSYVFKKFVLPKLIKIDTKEIEKNPKWIMNNIREKYYGFQDIDIILIETNLFSSSPRLRITKDDKYEFLIPNDTSTKDVDEVLRLAIMGKIAVKYGLVFQDKPIYWLSILCYMLDGGDIKETSARFEEKINKNKKPLDVS